MSRLLLAGYFGCGNLGDDAILVGFRDSLGNRDSDLRVLAGSPELVRNRLGLSAIPRTDLKMVSEAMDDCDALVFPGGSIFQDATSVRSVGYYYKLAQMAKKKGKKLAFLGQGVGPVNSMFGKSMTRKAFEMADLVCVRDPASGRTLNELGFKGKVHETADLAFTLKPNHAEGGSERFGVAGMKTVGLAIRPTKGKTNVATVFAEVTKTLYAKGWVPYLFEMDRQHDRPVMDAVGKANGGKVPEIKNLNTPGDAVNRLARLDAVIAMRLHAGILAATAGTPTFLVSYDPKVNALANLLGLQAPPSIEGLQAGRLCDLFLEFASRSERVAEHLPQRVAEQAEKARRNIELLDEMLGR